MSRPAIRVDGCTITPATLGTWRRGRTGYLEELAGFLDEWWGPAPTMQLQTSGSTGKPRIMTAAKAAMAASAAATCNFFGLRTGDTALLSLPLRYIAGKMMVVRALIRGLDLITTPPCSTPLNDLQTTVDFAPLVPMQVSATLAQSAGADQLARVRTLLLGGSFIDARLAEQLQHLTTRVFASYGMTETLSHIALRAINGPQRSEWYTPLPGIETRLAPGGTLQISAPHLGIHQLTTNDLAEHTPDGRFRILGRADAVINSGGVKIQAEEIEQALHRLTNLQVLALPLPHTHLGQCVALLWEGPGQAEQALRTACDSLPRYHRPRFICHAPIPRTNSGKPARAEALQLLNRIYHKHAD